MRVLMAGLFVTGGMLAGVALLSQLTNFDRHPIVLGFGLAAFGILLTFVAVVVFGGSCMSPLVQKSTEEYLRELEHEGLLTSSDFQVRRAFGVAEVADEGMHYFLELVDRRVLFLNGEYLYDYEPVSDDEQNQPRRFPCENFTIHRHKTEGYVVVIECRGAAIDPEFIAEPFSEQVWRSGDVPEDGQIVSDRSYDDVRGLMS